MVTPVGALVAAVVLGAVNLFIRPILLILTLPITILTLGLFSLVINALMAMLAAYLVPGLIIVGFWPAFFFALVLSIVNWVFNIWNRP
jgi:putative membrane protein